MRVKDENKNEAIFAATIDLLNEIGFADTSMSKIAKRANLSSATLYIYFENKDDMLKKTYLFVKQKMMEALRGAMTQGMSVRETIAALMRSMLEYLLENKAYFLFSEQFENSPFIEKLCLHDQADNPIHLYYDYFDKAKADGVLKNADTPLLIAYCYYPVIYLVKDIFNCGDRNTQERLEQAIELTWQAIRA